MIEWVSFRSGATPVPQPVATPLVWTGAVGGASVLVALLNHLVGPYRPTLVLTVLSLLAALLGLCARFVAAPGTALLCWLLLNGFGIPPAGTLTWAADRDAFWLSCLFGATLVGTVLARLVNAHAAYRRLGTAAGPLPPENDDGRNGG
ncbi:hypothetical protein ACQEV4_12855 [Streptomyces shenzhenensis]|uniref:hypothetical protein n=1 Tax=Streptomyces shenzhenensis TaxID=943815 RepID=UPI003D8BD2D8